MEAAIQPRDEKRVQVKVGGEAGVLSLNIDISGDVTG